jgi:hypothetical protein
MQKKVFAFRLGASYSKVSANTCEYAQSSRASHCSRQSTSNGAELVPWL